MPQKNIFREIYYNTYPLIIYVCIIDYGCQYLFLVNMVNVNLCFPIGSKSFLCNIEELEDDRTPINISTYQLLYHNTQYTNNITNNIQIIIYNGYLPDLVSLFGM